MKRVVVTGMGTINSLGHTVHDFWENIVAGKSGAQEITKFNIEHFKTKFACEVRDFEPKMHLDRSEIKRTDLFTQYGLYASAEAINDSGIDLNSISPFDMGVIWGSGNGGMGTFEEEVKAYAENNYRPHFNPFFVPKLLSNMASGLIAMKFGLMGINFTTVTACASANSAIMEAFNYIRLGKAKLFVTGGSEAPVTEAAIGGFNAMRAMSLNNDCPEEASRPFDKGRNGFVMGEGGGALILEEYEHAKARGAKIYAEVIGAAMTADAYHISSSHPEGLGAARAMNAALEEGEINAGDVDYLNAHATSTPVGDLSEIQAVRKVFGDNPEKLKISATKSMTGHLLGAAGAVEGIVCIKALQEGIVPPTINTTHLDDQIPKTMNIVLKESQKANLKYAMSNTFGFGGHNAIVLFKRFD
jgi:3-oxoacyl-[acyl-carrier-protein] synthase II